MVLTKIVNNMKPKQKMEIKSIYMPKGHWEALKAIAEKQDLSVNQVIRRLVSERVFKGKKPCAN
jgi:predicted DNA-binding ribbon-helix-helix protein